MIASTATMMRAHVPAERPPDPDPDPDPEVVLVAFLPVLALEELNTTLAALQGFERELSDLRSQLHAVMEVIDRVIADRRVAGAMG